MNNVTTYINGTDTQTLGIVLGDKSLTALMTPPPNKPYIVNECMDAAGVVVTESYTRVSDRNVQVVFGLMASSSVQFLSRYRAFCDILKSGKVDITISGSDAGVEVFRVTYHMYYISCQQFLEFNGRLGKFVLKMYEPNPENRIVEK